MLFEYYKFRIYPTPLQEVLLKEHFGAVRFVHNWALERYNALRKAGRRFPGWMSFATDGEFLKLKKDNAWMYAVGSQSLLQALADLGQSITLYERGSKGHPNFKSKKNEDCSFAVPKDFEFDFKHKKLRIPMFLNRDEYDNRLSFILSKRVTPGKIVNLRIVHDAAGRYFVSFGVHVDIPEPEPKTDLSWSSAVGYDFGLKHFLVGSNGEVIDSPDFYGKVRKRLHREQRRLLRKKKGSRNELEQQRRIKKLKIKAADRRRDFLHKLSARLAKESQFDYFCVEDLNLRGLIRRYGAAVRDKAFGTFVHYLTYKSAIRGKRVLKADKYEPTTQTCSGCGHRQKISLTKRMYTCGYCGLVLDRDVNAAINIRDAVVQTYRDSYFNTAGAAEIYAQGEGGSGEQTDAFLATLLPGTGNRCQHSGTPDGSLPSGSSPY